MSSIPPLNSFLPFSLKLLRPYSTQNLNIDISFIIPLMCAQGHKNCRFLLLEPIRSSYRIRCCARQSSLVVFVAAYILYRSRSGYTFARYNYCSYTTSSATCHSPNSYSRPRPLCCCCPCHLPSPRAPVAASEHRRHRAPNTSRRKHCTDLHGYGKQLLRGLHRNSCMLRPTRRD